MPKGEKNRKLSNEDRIELARLFTTPQEDGTWMGVPSIARRFGVAIPVVRYHLKRAGVSLRTSKEAFANGKRCKPITNVPVGVAPECKCGCGGIVAWNRRKNRWNRYIIGHYTQRESQGPTWIDGRSYVGYPPDWSDIATSIRRRDDWTCQDCGTQFPKRSGRLHVHHIDRDTMNSAESNLITLCASCHGTRHATGRLGGLSVA
jgi:5-methylcytosine-specific restriction endonuclease McrA